MEASESTPAQPDAEAQSTESTPAESAPQSPPDLSQIGEQIGALQERFDSQFPNEQQGDADFLSSLGWGSEQADPNAEQDGGEDSDNFNEGLLGQPGQDQFGGEQPPMFNSQQELDSYVSEKAAEVLQPYAFQQEMNARRDSLGKLEEKYPDIGEYADRIRGPLEARAEQYGINPQFLATDPALVEAMYKGLKADEASSTEVDAQAASNAGASLETGTGPGSQGQQEDPDEAFKSALLQTAGRDPFTS